MNSATGATEVASVSLGSEQNSGASVSSMYLLAQIKGILEAAEAKVAGYDELSSLLESEQRIVGRLQRALQMQHTRIEHSTRQLAARKQDFQRLQDYCRSLEKQLNSAQARIVSLQQENRCKRVKVSQPAPSAAPFQLEKPAATNEQDRIAALEHRLQSYESICSYVALQTKELQHETKTSPACTSEQLPPPGQTSSEEDDTTDDVLSQAASEGGAVQNCSTAEGVAGLLALISTGDVSSSGGAASQTSGDTGNQVVPSRGWPEDSNSAFHLPPKLRGGPIPKRAAWLILARHPQAPGQVPVICKQLTGMLLLGNPCDQLKIRANSPGQPVLSPGEFEATAGCSKGKNWKANIKVQGTNGRNQMLKYWLLGLVQLVGDHVKTEVHQSAHIFSLLDAQSGLRLLSEQ